MVTADVSVIIPCYKSSGTIKRAVESVYQQTLRPKEVILVDDCSCDDTPSTLHKIKDIYPNGWVVIVFLNVNVGAGSARNRGWEKATGKYIAFLDSDDSWHAQKIELQYNWMKDNSHVGLTGHTCAQVGMEFESESIVNVSKVSFKKIKKAELLISNSFSTPSIMLRSDLPFRYVEGKRYSEDYQLWLEIALSDYPCYKACTPLAYIHKAAYGEGGLSAHLWKMEKGELSTLKSVKDKKLITKITYVFLCCFSMIKFIKRNLVRYIFRERINSGV
ncbi:glycosyltransferase family 2 protein [Halomonas halocynthiae]|uniref:glycosyltransferase family 2 protein n=1 Tax=Halomonas halocynthiae TaxID=176290 RepID=UPI000484F326|nr:glycosyltransferase [Halomonas halocynthiae]